MTRRSTFDWVLRRAAGTEPGLTLRGGVPVTGLLARPGARPRVVGVRTPDGDVGADLVVDATGRRSGMDRWLAALGAPPPVTEQAECGMAYYSRHYRLRTATGLPGPPTTRVVAALDEFTIGIWGADNATMVLALVPLVEDRRFRSAARADVFTAVVRSVPLHASWLDVLEPISPVFPMGGLHNTHRRLVADGAPVAGGVVALGDSVCTTNPTLGRGLSLALRSAVDLVDALHADGEDPVRLVAAADRAAAQHVAPFYVDQAAIDAARLADLRHTVLGAPAPSAPEQPDRVSFAQLRAAAPLDPLVFRAFWRVMGMIGLPEQVYTDPEVVTRVHGVLREHGSRPPITQPDRDRLAAALAG
jgi:2-polyprenyl-6-methoxyphenol hydroxylase-like FAD-dependent oxidoreductase